MEPKKINGNDYIYKNSCTVHHALYNSVASKLINVPDIWRFIHMHGCVPKLSTPDLEWDSARFDGPCVPDQASYF